MVIAVLLAFFARVGSSLVKPVQRGIAVSVAASAAAAALFAGADNQALWEGVLALLGAIAVAWLIVYTRSTMRAPRASHGRLVTLAMFLVTVLLITRGGMEISLFLGTLIAQVPRSDVLIGAQLGVAIAIVVALVWTRLAPRTSGPQIARVTTVFLALFCVHLIVDGVHEVAEANVLPGTERLYSATEPYGSDGIYGQYAPYVLLAVLLLWLLVAIFWGHGKASDGGVTHVDR